MAHFVKLTTKNGNDIHINFDLVESYGTINTNSFDLPDETFIGYTYVIPVGMHDGDTPYIVLESPEEVLKKVEWST